MADSDERPSVSRDGLRKTILLCLVAMAAGYFFSGRLDSLWRDDSGVKHDFEVMHTYARITIPKGEGDLPPAELAQKAEAAVREINDLMGPFGEFSDVRRLNSLPAKQWTEVNPLTWTVVMEALRWNRLTDGAFDPTIGPIKKLFRFDQIQVDSLPSAAELDAARQKVGADKLLFRREGMELAFEKDGMKLDLGAIAKGFAADRAAEVLLAHGVRNALVDIGGELRVLGLKPGDPSSFWRAGVRDPRRDGYIEELSLSNSAVATSGDYENYFIYNGKRYEHIIDPRSGQPLTEGVASVTVIHPDSCLAADALATSLTVMGVKEGGKFIRSQSLGLFSSGLRVIMIAVGEGGKLTKTEFLVDDRGEVTETTEDLP